MSSTGRAAAERVLPLIDLTLLGDDDTPEDVQALCDQATTPFGRVAAICVWPEFVGLAVRRLEGTGIPVAGVANFPEGADDAERAIIDAELIVNAGGREVDVVFPWRSLADGQAGVGAELIATTRAAIGDDIVLKAILETGELADPALVRTAADEAIAGGADFLKTSTGKTERGASLEAAKVLFEAVSAADRPVGVKMSGGVRTVSQAGEYLDLADEMMGAGWVGPATLRFGASSLLDDILRALEHAGGRILET